MKYSIIVIFFLTNIGNSLAQNVSFHLESGFSLMVKDSILRSLLMEEYTPPLHYPLLIVDDTALSLVLLKHGYDVKDSKSSSLKQYLFDERAVLLVIDLVLCSAFDRHNIKWIIFDDIIIKKDSFIFKFKLTTKYESSSEKYYAINVFFEKNKKGWRIKDKSIKPIGWTKTRGCSRRKIK